MTQPAFSQQLAVLRKAGLVESESKGNVRLYRITPAPLYQVVDWMAHYDKFWEGKLDRLDDYIAKRIQEAKNKSSRKEPT